MHIVFTQTTTLRPLVLFAHRHDELSWFKIWFTISTVVASIVFNLGVFFLLVCMHMGLDTIKYKTRFKLSWRQTAIETYRESLLDLFFIVFGILLTLAFHHAAAIGGLGRLAEAEVLFLGLILRIGPRLKIAEHLLEVITYWKQHFHAKAAPLAPFTKGERWLSFATGLTTLCILLVPLLRTLTLVEVGRIAQRELTPRLELNIRKTVEELRH